MLERGLGAQHPFTAMARVHAGMARAAAGKRDDGERLIRQGVDTLEAQYPYGSPDLASAWFALGESIEEARAGEGRAFFLKALAWRERHFGPTDRRTIEARDAGQHAGR